MTATGQHKGGYSTRKLAPATAAELPFLEASLGGGWCLPQGQALPEFALESGFLAPQLLALDSHIRPLEDLGVRRRERARR